MMYRFRRGDEIKQKYGHVVKSQPPQRSRVSTGPFAYVMGGGGVLCVGGEDGSKDVGLGEGQLFLQVANRHGRRRSDPFRCG
jgi:hypothetical protein